MCNCKYLYNLKIFTKICVLSCFGEKWFIEMCIKKHCQLYKIKFSALNLGFLDYSDFLMVRKFVFSLQKLEKRLHYMLGHTNYGHTKAKSLILCSQNSNPNPKYSFGIGIWIFFCRNNDWIMENMDKRPNMSTQA